MNLSQSLESNNSKTPKCKTHSKRDSNGLGIAMSPLALAREEIRNKGDVYLGDTKSHSELAWVNVRNRHDRISKKDDTSNPAILYAIVYISKNGYRMTPCSDWDPFYEGFGVEFRQAKANGIAQDPGVPELQGDFVNSCQFIANAVDDRLRRDGMGRGQSNPLRYAWTGGFTGFKIQHRLFRAKWDGFRDWYPHPDPQFRIENWPINWPAEGEELQKIMNTHVVVPLPANDMEGNLIHPSQYEEKLKGAVVRVGFVLNHYFPLGGFHRFTADIHEMQVLQPPEPEPVVVPSPPQGPLSPPPSPSPKRKRTAERDGYDDDSKVKREIEGSPTKRRKSSANVKCVVKKEEVD